MPLETDPRSGGKTREIRGMRPARGRADRLRHGATPARDGGEAGREGEGTMLTTELYSKGQALLDAGRAYWEEAQKAGAVLGRNYPESYWYNQSLRLLGRENRQVQRRTASRK